MVIENDIINLGFNLDFTDLYSQTGLEKLDKYFLEFLQETNSHAYEALIWARKNPTSLAKSDYADLLLKCPPILDDFITILFQIEQENNALKISHSKFDQIYECKRKFIMRQVLKNYNHSMVSLINFLDISQKLTKLLGQITEHNLAKAILLWLNFPDNYQVEITLAEKYCAYMIFNNSSLNLFDIPRKIDPLNHIRDHKIKQLSQNHYIGFDYRDHQQNTPKAILEAKYCIYCHNQDKDHCSTGIPQDKDLQNEKSGCPLKQKISEMNKIKDLGFNIGALAIITIDNPLVALTGHRICNDCMKSCIYQKQDPVNIPIIESNILDNVLNLTWGVEIYLLLTKWNPLNIVSPLPKKATNYNILITGLGPSGCALSHYLLQEGHNVIAIDGLKIAPLEIDLSRPIKNWSLLKTDLSKREPQGFGGVAEYGITNRWDKNYLTLIRLILARKKNFNLYDGLRLGSNIMPNQAYQYGFDHIALCIGAGKPKFMQSGEFFTKGIKSAADFLMSLSQGGAFLKNSNTKISIRLPALVIGCGLTAIDSAVELIHYYPEQVENFLQECESLKEKPTLSQEDQLIADEFIEHANLFRKTKNSTEKLEIMQKLGLVTICYRRKINESPAYLRNHEEIEHAMSLGIKFIEEISPKSIIKDQFNHIQAVEFSNSLILPAKTLLIAIGTESNEFIDLDESEQSKMSYFGDCDPTYSGSVVKAIASAKDGYHNITRQLITKSPKYQNSFEQLNSELYQKFTSTIKEITTLPNDVIKLVIHSPLSAHNFKPGQFFRLQNYTQNIKDSLKPLAISPIDVNIQEGLISFLIKKVGKSTRLCQHLQKNEKILLMGPTGQAININHSKIVLLIGYDITNFTLLPLAKAYKLSGASVILLASDERYDQNEQYILRKYIDKVIFYNKFTKFSELEIVKDSFKNHHPDQIICNLPNNLIPDLQIKLSNLFSNTKISFCLNSRMGCMMKGICGACISKTENKDGYIFACISTYPE